MRSSSVALLFTGLVLTGCQASGGGRPTGGLSQPPAKTQTGEPDYDPEKAFLRLAEILPAAEFPEPATSRPAEMPAQAVRRIMKGKELYKENRFTEAILELEKALQYAPQSFQVNRLLAVVCRKAGNDGRAVSHLRKAVKTKPDDVSVRYLLGMYAAEAETIDEALTQFALALRCPDAGEDNPYRALTHYRLAELLADQGYLTAAAGQYQEFLRLIAAEPAAFSEDAELVGLTRLGRGTVSGKLADLYERLGRTEEAVAALARAIGASPKDFALQRRYARLLSRVERHDEAIDVATNAMTARPEEPEGISLLLEVHEAAGKPDQALDVLRGLIETRPEDRDLSLALFEALAERQRDAEAEEILRKLLEKRPRDVDVRWRLTRFYEDRKRWMDAVVEVGRIVEADPAQADALDEFIDRVERDSEAWDGVLARSGAALAAAPNAYGLPHVIGLLAAADWNYAEARQMQKRALEIRTDFAPARIALAEVYLKEYAWEKAIEICEQAIKAEAPQGAFHRILGQAYDALDDVEKATDHYLEAARIDRRDLQAMLLLAKLYERTGKQIKALRQYTNILSIDSGMHAAREALIRLHLTGKVDFEAAKKQLDAFAKYGKDTPDYARAREFFRLREMQFRQRVSPGTAAAREQLTAYADGLTKVAEKFPENAGSLYVAGLSAFQVNKYDEAIAWCRKALTIDPDHIPARELLIYVYRRVLDYPKARGVLESLLKQRPNRRSWKLLLAEQCLIEQNFGRAAEIYQDVLADNIPADRRDAYRRNLIDALQMAGRIKHADELLDGWIKEETDEKKTAVYRQIKIMLQYWSGNDERALDIVKKWYERDPTNMQVRLQLIQALLQSEKPLGALRHVRRWLGSDPENRTLDSLMVPTLVAAQRYEDAVELTRNDAEVPERRYGSRVALAEVLGKAGRRDEQVRVLQDIIKDRRAAGERVAEDIERVIHALMSAKRFKEAEQLLTLKIDEEREKVKEGADPALLRAWLRLLSFSYQRDNKTRLAGKVLDDILELYPEDAGICNDLGYTLADAGLDLDRAEKLIRIAVGQAPRSNAYLDSLGWVLYKKGDFAGAKRWLQRAVRARSMLSGSLDTVDDPVLHDHLGDALWRLGETEAAVAAWKRAVTIFEGLLRRQVDREDTDVLENARKKITAVERGQPPPAAEIVNKDAA